MTEQPDTAAIREFYSRYPDDTVLALCDALDAARAEQLAAIREAVGDCCGYRTRAEAAELAEKRMAGNLAHQVAMREAAEARIAAVRELCRTMLTCPCDDHCRVIDIRRALTGGTE